MKVVSKRPKRHSFLLFLILTLIISSLLYNSDQLLDPPKKVPFAEFRADLNEGLISDNAVSIKGDKLTFKAEDATKFSYKEESASLSDMLSADEYELLNIPIMSGFGFGLPLANLHAKYFGGKLSNMFFTVF